MRFRATFTFVVHRLGTACEIKHNTEVFIVRRVAVVYASGGQGGGKKERAERKEGSFSKGEKKG